MFWTIFLFAVILMSFVVVGLGIQTFFSKKKKFPEYRISKNRELKKRKIYCAEVQQAIIDKQIKKGDSKKCDICM